LAPRVASVIPDAFLHRLGENLGYGPSANVVTTLVEGSSHFLFCHDDVILEADAVRRMVEEAFRTNAGIVAPKFVAVDEPDRILQVGLGVDRFGAPVRRVERLEFDQQQYDETQEVFAVPGGCTLIRTDLFVALGGFDPKISMFGEDVDLCWRARTLGARIIVAPTATVGHLEATAARLRPMPEARALQWRHEVRAVLKNYGALRRSVVAIELAIWSLIEVVYFAARGRRSRVRQVVGAWRWNLASEQGLRKARAEVRESRRLSDREVGKLMTRGSFRASRFLTPILEEIAERRRDGHLQPIHPLDDARRHPKVTAAVVVAVVIVLVGSRSILTGKLPLIGTFLPLPSPTTLLGHYFGGWDNSGLQRPGPSSPAFAILGFGGIVFFGAMGVLEKVLIFGSIVAGAFGVARLVRPLGPPIARAAASICYLFLPLAWDDVARGDLPGLIAYGATPFLLLGLFRGTGIDPYGAAVVDRRTFGRQIVIFGVLLAASASFVPLLAILLPALAVALALSCIVLGNRTGGLRVLGVGFGGAVAAFVLCLPWSLTFVQRGVSWSALTGAATAPARAPQLGAILRLDLGPFGSGILGLAFLGAALFVLVATDDDRFAWSARLWSIVLGSAAIAWAGAEGWLGHGVGQLRVVTAPLAVGIATLVGLGVASVASDIRHLHVGWRHLAGLGFVVLSLAGLIPIIGGSLSGRWGLPGSGYDSVFDWTRGSGTSAPFQRTIWLGDPTVLPLPGWQSESGVAIGISSGGLPNGSALVPGANPSRMTGVESAIGLAEAGRTVRLGELLAPLGVRYLIVPSTLAPILAGEVPDFSNPPPQILLDALTVQADLHELPSEGGALVFENTEWRPGSFLAGPGGLSPILRTFAVFAEFVGIVALLTQIVRRRRRNRRGARLAAASVGRGFARSSPEPAPDEPVLVGISHGEEVMS
ncbi:MAG TPA: glycosyltransferase family 2 protein, partial [Acidimicrobiales bacterium]|nr:glycosyltransferase family 2 protein [Acidimicrobiales bacterium]